MVDYRSFCKECGRPLPQNKPRTIIGRKKRVNPMVRRTKRKGEHLGTLTVNCRWCKKPFVCQEGTPRIYCSRSCFAEYRQEQVRIKKQEERENNTIMRYYNAHLKDLIFAGASMEDAIHDAQKRFGVDEERARSIIRVHGIFFPRRKDDESQ